MKSRIFIITLVVALAAAFVGGTMAWFTAKAEVENEFTAGTVMIDARETGVFKADVEVLLDNVNPGDCYEKTIRICNEGSKNIVLRMQFEDEWEFDVDYLMDNYYALCFSNDPKYEPAEYDRAALEKAIENLINPVYENITVEGWGFNVNDRWWYYEGAPLAGTDGDNDVVCIDVKITVCFDGDLMTNHFQQASYTLTTSIQALQASNEASESVWNMKQGADGKWFTDSYTPSWTGVWETILAGEGIDNGTSIVTFTQVNDTVTGTAPALVVNRWYEGTVDGQSLSGTWGWGTWEVGTFEITRSDDFQSFTGEKVEAVDPPRTYSWSGIRQ